MNRLYLIRHAKSSWANPGLDDIERPLNKRGKRDAPFMAKRLKQFEVYPDVIYTSPAKRARKTAKHIALGVGYPVDKIRQLAGIYTSDLNRLLTVVQETPAEVNTLFLIGHNYVLTDLAEYLTGQTLINVPTCGIVGMEFDVDVWRDVYGEGAQMLFFDYPKKHAGTREE